MNRAATPTDFAGHALAAAAGVNSDRSPSAQALAVVNGFVLTAEVGLLDALDPRSVSTVDAMEEALSDVPYMRRHEAADDFGRPETAFNTCTFWRINALAKIGRKAQAREIFETMLAARNPPGLLAQGTHPVSGEMWGNFPPTDSMGGIINAAVRPSAGWDRAL